MVKIRIIRGVPSQDVPPVEGTPTGARLTYSLGGAGQDGIVGQGNIIGQGGSITSRPAVAKWRFVAPIVVVWVLISVMFFGSLVRPYGDQTWLQAVADRRLVGESFLAALVIITIGAWLIYRHQLNRGMGVYDYVQSRSGTCLASTLSGDAFGLTADELVVPPTFGSQPRTVPLDAIKRVTVSIMSQRPFLGGTGENYLTVVHKEDGQTLRFFAPTRLLGALLGQLQAARPNIVFDGLGLKLVEMMTGTWMVGPPTQA